LVSHKVGSSYEQMPKIAKITST